MNNTTVSLSTYFPKGTEYFYSYPAGAESNFFNNVDPEIEELVAARLLACAGDVKVMVFDATHGEHSVKDLHADLHIPCAENVVVLPSHITCEVRGSERNDLVRAALKKHATPGQLVMAQPFLDADLADYYQISPQLSVWLNDKQRMPEYTPAQFLATRYREYENGHAFAQDESTLPVPCVVKVASSSSGDGVRICHDASDLEMAKSSLHHLQTSIFIEEYIEAEKNFGVQFAIPHNADADIEILGFNQQLTTEQGEFLGGFIDNPDNHPELTLIYQLLKTEILPQIRAKGWYGVGGFDVLTTTTGRTVFVDANFRATGMTAYIFMVKNGLIPSSMASFAATFHGTKREFRRHIAPLVEQNILKIISLTYSGGLFRINAAVLFDDEYTMEQHAKMLLKAGLHTSVLRSLSKPRHIDPIPTPSPVFAPVQV